MKSIFKITPAFMALIFINSVNAASEIDLDATVVASNGTELRANVDMKNDSVYVRNHEFTPSSHVSAREDKNHYQAAYGLVKLLNQPTLISIRQTAHATRIVPVVYEFVADLTVYNSK